MASCGCEPGQYATAHGAHRPVCGGRCLLVHVGTLNCVPWCFFLFTPPVFLWFWAVPRSGVLDPTLAALLSVVCAALFAASVITLLGAHLTEPGLLPTMVEDVSVLRPPQPSAPQPYWPLPSFDGPGNRALDRASRADAFKARVVVLEGQQHQLKVYRAKVCRETEMAVEEFDHFCPWVGNVVGRRNYRWFVGFVVSVTSLAGFVVLSCGFLLHEEAQTIDPCADYNTTATTVPAHGRAHSWCRGDFATLLADAVAAQPLAAGLAFYAGLLFCGPFGLCSYHLSLISRGQTTNEDIKGLRLAHDRRGCAENWAHFCCGPSRRSYVAASSGLLQAGLSLEPIPITRAGDLDEFAAGEGTLGAAAAGMRMAEGAGEEQERTLAEGARLQDRSSSPPRGSPRLADGVVGEGPTLPV